MVLYTGADRDVQRSGMALADPFSLATRIYRSSVSVSLGSGLPDVGSNPVFRLAWPGFLA